ncbi:ParB/RepB/Spo0J family partition protein [Halalkalibacter akibai]|uniref:ParB-like nuclease domain protein n=1 Tax=Halalkalibacter akibai (strain ATCC 43226 / DSM 21942 / CIP 109018 / JCM 9157 / 1139) TaxID=1236973 RepID=W4QZA9_HALA3|nr:ParB/RepB/Spo0J family partition protein [Halalkalibacter akibai]GAE36649.1 ParB-like nuclease domain protein [Halalkalibacter akibai JCM 9157]
MSKQPKKIKLSQIRLETSYRKSEKDLSLELSISRQGLNVPLIVEEEGKNQYVLVDGYRRFYALEFLGMEDAECSVEKLSSEEERIVKRLGIELHTKKRTAYQLERMINRLLESEKYDTKLIASLCGVTEETIKKYIRGSGVKPEWLKKGEKNNAGRHAYTDILHLNINEVNKDYIADKYGDKQINKNTVGVIKKATNEKAFKDIPNEHVKECVNQIIEQQSKNYETVKEIVCENSLQAKYTKSSHTFMYNLTLVLIKRIERIFSIRNYAANLSVKQKENLSKSLTNLILVLNPPLKWSDFPKNEQSPENLEDDDGESLVN